MSSPSSLKALHSIHPSPSPPSSSLSSMKLKTLLQTFVFSHMYRVARAVSKAKSVLLQLLKDLHYLIHLAEFPLRKNSKNRQKKLYFGSFRLHYNWCSSRTVPVVLQSCSTRPPSLRYDGMEDSGELAKYLQWLEEKGDEDSCNEIDRLADLFIKDCHEKFMLEKQESYRSFREMMARSV